MNKNTTNNSRWGEKEDNDKLKIQKDLKSKYR